MIPEAIATSGAKAFLPLLANLVAKHMAKHAVSDESQAKKLRTRLQPHLATTFEKCLTIKTLLNPSHPVDFLSIYSTQRFKCLNRNFDQYGLVEFLLTTVDRAIITGSGGSGKSMFMKYLWLALFERSDGRFPIFIELRAFNTVTTPSLREYIFQSLSAAESSITRKDFDRKLRDGDFIFLLDGFDEIVKSKRDQIVRDILFLSENYRSTKFFVSSRPDDGFNSWSNFNVIEVLPLLRQDTLELIGKAPFDDTTKQRFLKEIRNGHLYETHQSFMENPLLAAMMLLTFSMNFGIPDRLTSFYAQAFDALYQRHDTHKPGGYTREFSSNLSEDDFKRLFSYFCLVTYHKQQYSFDRDQIIEAIKTASRTGNIEEFPEKYLDDLCNCVCLLVKEGLMYTFSHRSFQEYFAAYCLSKLPDQAFITLSTQYISRRNDVVMQMLSELVPERFNDGILAPLSRKFSNRLKQVARRRDVVQFAQDTKATLGFEMSQRKGPKHLRAVYYSWQDDGEFADFVNLLNSLSHREVTRTTWTTTVPADRAFVDAVISKTDLEDSYSISVQADEAGFYYTLPGFSKRLRSSDLDEALSKTMLYRYLVGRMKYAASFIQESLKDTEQAQASIEEILRS